MKKKKVFCYECRNDVAYTIKEVNMVGKLKGTEYPYIGSVGYCEECKAEAYIPEVDDHNLKALYDIYRKENNIIPLEKIIEIPEMYDIGKRPLSLLLGWGEQTFTRYLDGDMPTKQYSEILQKIYNTPKAYIELLEKNKGNLKSTTAYEKSKRKVENLLEIEGGALSKIDEVIDYVLIECEDITPLALQKVLYYIQGFYYAFYEKFEFDDDCEAWVHGPVYKDIYVRYCQYRFDPIESLKESNTSMLTTTEKAIIDSVIKNLSCYSGKTLEKFTHFEKPWLETRGELLPNVASSRIVEKELIGQYFLDVKEKYNMLSSADIKVYSDTMFNRI